MLLTNKQDLQNLTMFICNYAHIFVQVECDLLMIHILLVPLNNVNVPVMIRMILSYMEHKVNFH